MQNLTYPLFYLKIVSYNWNPCKTLFSTKIFLHEPFLHEFLHFKCKKGFLIVCKFYKLFERIKYSANLWVCAQFIPYKIETVVYADYEVMRFHGHAKAGVRNGTGRESRPILPPGSGPIPGPGPRFNPIPLPIPAPRWKTTSSPWCISWTRFTTTPP